MKNQNDLIISIVAIVLALIIAGVCFGTKREPATIAAPEKVNLAPPVLPQGDVVMTNALPGGGSAAGGGMGAAMGGGGGRPGALGSSTMGGPSMTGASGAGGGPGRMGAPGGAK